MSLLGSDGLEWPHTMDPKLWVQQFLEHTKPEESRDSDVLASWFSSALMAGFDCGRIKLAERM